MGVWAKGRYLAVMLLICALLSSSAMARNWHLRHAKATTAAQTQDDSAEKKTAQESPAQEQPAQDQSTSDKSEEKKSASDKAAQAPESTGKTEEQKDSKASKKQAPAEPNQSAPDANAPNSGQPNSGQPGATQAPPAPANSQPGTTPDANAPQTGTPETPAPGGAGEAPITSTEKSNSSSAPKVSNHTHKNSNRTKIVREGGAAEANALLSPSMSVEQASRQIQNTTQLLASAEANLRKISTRKLNTDQEAMVDQVHSYMQQATDALNRGDLQRGHNLALKASLLADDLARH